MLSDEWLSRYGLLENFNASVARTGTRTGTGTWTTGVTAIALCTSCSLAKNVVFYLQHRFSNEKILICQSGMKTHWHGILVSTCLIMLEMAPAKKSSRAPDSGHVNTKWANRCISFHFFMSIVIVNFIRVDLGRS